MLETLVDPLSPTCAAVFSQYYDDPDFAEELNDAMNN